MINLNHYKITQIKELDQNTSLACALAQRSREFLSQGIDFSARRKDFVKGASGVLSESALRIETQGVTFRKEESGKHHLSCHLRILTPQDKEVTSCDFQADFASGNTVFAIRTARTVFLVKALEAFSALDQGAEGTKASSPKKAPAKPIAA